MVDLLRRYLFGSMNSMILRAPEDDGDNGGFDDDDFDTETDMDDPDDADPDDQDDADPDDQDQDDQDPPQQQRQPSRAETRAAKLARERNEERAKREAAERELNQLRQQAAQPQQPRETPEQFQARLAAMDPYERNEYLIRMNAQATAAQMQQMQFRLEDQTDKIGFASFCAQNPQAKKLEQEVETRLATYRQQGMNIPRLDVLKHVLGDRALSNLGRSKSRAERGAEARRDQQKGRPTGARGDAGRESRREQDSKAARYKRLENLKI